MIETEKHPSEYDKRTKIYKTWKKEQDNVTTGGTTETLLVEVIEEETKEEFQLEGNGPEDIKIARLSMAIKERIPTYLLSEIMNLVDCECRIEAYDKFMDTPFPVTVGMQNALNKIYYEFFKERIRRTSCSTCIKRRINRIREQIKLLVNG